MKELLGAPVTVTLPAQPDLVHVIRSVAAAVAARLDLSIDELDDLRIAVDEACAQLVRAAAPDANLEVRLTPTSEGLELVAGVKARAGVADSWPPQETEASLAWRVLSALVDDLFFSVEGDGLRVRFLKRVAEDEHGQE